MGVDFLRYFVLAFAIIIVIVNLYFLLDPFNRNNIEDQIEDYLNTIIISSEQYNQDLQKLGLLPHSSNLGNQIREKMTQEASLIIIEVEKDSCIIEITNYEYGILFVNTLEDFIIDDSMSFEQNRINLLEEVVTRTETGNLNQKSWLVELELVINDGVYEPLLNSEFYNALYGGLLENMGKYQVDLLYDGDQYE